MTQVRRTFAVVLAVALPGMSEAAPEPDPSSAARQWMTTPPAETSAATPTGGALGTILARADAAWSRRDEPGGLEALRSSLEEARAAAPDDYDVLWRVARFYSWTADDPAIPDTEKSRLGKIGWEVAERATAKDPNRVEGWFYAATNMGNYALGIGILKALGEGIEGKFRERLSAAERIDARFDFGGVYDAWGRFYYKLPWPKYDARKSERALQEAIRVNASNVRARVYLAELYIKEKHPKEARRVLQDAVAHAPGAYDAPEERRNQARARELLAELDR